MDVFLMSLPTILKTMVMGAVPILLASLGEVFSERAGLVNIGLEGVMAIGAFVGFAIGKMTGNLWLGLVVGMLAGIAVNLLYGFCTVTLCADVQAKIEEYAEQVKDGSLVSEDEVNKKKAEL